jgi:4-amino-4-deoxy-L-arabinose transferase-like glycosyltransferase
VTPTGIVDDDVPGKTPDDVDQRSEDDRAASPPLLSPSVSRAVLGVCLLGLMLRLAMVARPLTIVDRLFVPDDAYYTLAIARSLAEGLGPSADSGVTLTTGFQPLIVLLTVPFSWLSSDPGLPLRAVLVVSAFADVVVIVLLARLAARIAGPAAALVAAALWAVSPYAVGVSLNGLESTLALAVSLALVEVWCLAREGSGLRRWAAAGALAGLALLARIDTVFLVALLGLVEVASGRRRSVLVAAGTAGAVTLPWWAYSVALTGSPIPESGSAAQELGAVHRSVGLEMTDSLGLAVGRVVGAPVVDLPVLRTALVDHPLRALVATVVLCLGLTAAAVWAGTRRRAGVRQLPLLALGLHAVVLVLFYGVVNTLPWFFDRYLLPVAAVFGLVLATAVGSLWSGAERWRARPASLPAPALATILVTLAAVTVPAAESIRLLGTRPAGSAASGYEGGKGYAEVAREVLSQLPAGAVVGSLQSGALGYFAEYAPQGVQVVNLDGVVDGEAAQALAGHRLPDYMHARGVTHFADWPFNASVLHSRSGAARVGTPELHPIGAAQPQGGETFGIARVAYPGAP